jgi:hypothetical protein
LQNAECDGLEDLLSFNFPELKCVGNNVYFDGCNSLSVMDFPKLETVGDQILIRGAVSSATFPALTDARNIFIADCPNLSVLDFSLLSTEGGMSMDNCPLITSLSFPSLASMDGGMTINFVNLVELSLPQMIYDCSFADFTGCALSAASVEAILARAVISWGVSTCDLDINLSGGTSAGLASLSAQGQADYATLIGEGNMIVLNP